MKFNIKFPQKGDLKSLVLLNIPVFLEITTYMFDKLDLFDMIDVLARWVGRLAYARIICFFDPFPPSMQYVISFCLSTEVSYDSQGAWLS